MADVAPPDINMTASVAEASRPPPAETPLRPVEAPFPAAPADEPLPDAMSAQPPPPAQSEADRMPPTPVSDEPGAETRPG